MEVPVSTQIEGDMYNRIVDVIPTASSLIMHGAPGSVSGQEQERSTANDVDDNNNDASRPSGVVVSSPSDAQTEDGFEDDDNISDENSYVYNDNDGDEGSNNGVMRFSRIDEFPPVSDSPRWLGDPMAPTLYRAVFSRDWAAAHHLLLTQSNSANRRDASYVSPPPERETTLRAACLRGAPANLIEALLTAKAESAWAVDGSRRIPLHHACRSATGEVIQLLLECHPQGYGAEDTDGRTPLDVAREEKRDSSILSAFDDARRLHEALSSQIDESTSNLRESGSNQVEIDVSSSLSSGSSSPPHEAVQDEGSNNGVTRSSRIDESTSNLRASGSNQVVIDISSSSSSGSSSPPQEAVQRRVSPRQKKLKKPNFKGMDGGPSKTTYYVGPHGGCYRGRGAKRPNSAI